MGKNPRQSRVFPFADKHPDDIFFVRLKPFRANGRLGYQVQDREFSGEKSDLSK
jgi:hypothetical protein